MKNQLNFNEENKITMSSEEVLSIIDQEDKVTIIFKRGFREGSDTEDVFRGIYGDQAFEENEVFISAMEFGDSPNLKHTFFLNNDITGHPFGERCMVKRLISDNFWSRVILHDHPLKEGSYAHIINRNKKLF